ncbi:MAG: hypothetical protein MUF87_22445 [Anaerolineae bacterium]|jgi:hypothetical protein|nr:hypothetical protein [Anaerolineae bacterium]
MAINRDLFDQLVEVIEPHVIDPDQRAELVYRNLYDSPILREIKLEGTPRSFTLHFVATLLNWDEGESLLPVLSDLKERKGETQRLNQLLQALEGTPQLELKELEGSLFDKMTPLIAAIMTGLTTVIATVFTLGIIGSSLSDSIPILLIALVSAVATVAIVREIIKR